ncbi:type II CRISPR RNA-guided endonuclease Cas9 [Capnocytophaga canimorsus]|uniref:type II CRISPR RNA-guided endonuclease Cas9 n=1 Tax=Capnocytophaga canimorsus TaxID=28188 RepID=UPI000BB1EF6C|nr:type II CRISPR RNA-guided endonuclease Cas9 [Capnocytophaga canimorsus]ATA76596.1 type II CRISPR RNA-guided endonuclease Cas9 [Capnocytophaga canimorsus]PJI77005.1 CRISPR subtype II RNA-guided endonuclease Cas9/Csn1 [Capnocytophaga canimorsus]STA71763.1 Uncharacterized protein conserved in bacteria [Capnocytophaga canimorsus]
MKHILGLDLGTNSIGWALIERNIEEKYGKIIGMGSRIVPMGAELSKFEQGQAQTKNADRRTNRGARRLNKRYKQRRNKLIYILQKLDMLPSQIKLKEDFSDPNKIDKITILSISKKQEQLTVFDLVSLRVKALTEKVGLEDLGKIIYKYNQLRGYAGGSLEPEKEDIFDEEQSKDKKNKSFIAFSKIVFLGEPQEEIFKNKKLNRRAIIVETEEENFEGSTFLENIKVGDSLELLINISASKSGDTITIKLPNKTNWRKKMENIENQLKEKSKEMGREFYISEFLLELLKENRWAKIRNNTILRARYESEFEAIWNEQVKHYPFLENLDKKTLIEIVSFIFPGEKESQKKYRELGLEKGLKYIIKNQVVFYQRELKDQSHLISDCRYEPNEKAIAKSHPVFQEYKVWEQINKLIVNTKIEAGTNRKGEKKYKYIDRPIPTALKEWIFEELQNKKEITFSAIFKKLKAEFDLREGIDFLNGMNPKDKLKGNETKLQLQKSLGKLWDVLGLDSINRQIELWNILYNEKGNEYDLTSDRTSKVLEFINKYGNNIVDDNAEEIAIKISKIKFARAYSSLSLKAIERILPLVRAGKYFNNDFSQQLQSKILKLLNENVEDPFAKAAQTYLDNNQSVLSEGGVGNSIATILVYDKHTAKEYSHDELYKSYKEINLLKQGDLRNPLVEQIINEALVLIRDIWKNYGIKPNEIRVELARDLKNSAKERATIHKRNKDNQTINNKIKETLVKNKKELSLANIEKVKLWEAQRHLSPYTGQPIPLSDLFDKEKYDVDHIIPISRYFDDSFTNKVISEKSVNQEKANRTAMEYFEVGSLKYSIFTKEQFIAHVNEYFSGVKRKNLLATSIPEDPVQRQIKDTQYIAIRVKEELNKIVGNENVKTTTGSITDYLRNHWGLTDKFKLLLKERYEALLESEKFLESEYDNYKKDFDSRKKEYEEKEILFEDQELTKEEFIKEYKENYIRYKKNKLIIKGWSKRIDHRHHAIDALIVACTEPAHIKRLNDLNKVLQDWLVKHKSEFMPNFEGSNSELLEEILSLPEKDRREIFTQIDKFRAIEMPWKGFPEQVEQKLKEIIISHKPKDKLLLQYNKAGDRQIKLRGQLHEGTLYGISQGKEAYRIPLTKFSGKKFATEKNIQKIVSPFLSGFIANHLKEYNNKKEEAFSAEGIMDLNNKLAQYRNEKGELKPHTPISTVKIYYKDPSKNKKKKDEEDLSLQKLDREKAFNEKLYVKTGDNYLFAVMEGEIKTKKTSQIKRLYDIISFFDATNFLKEEFRNAPDKKTFDKDLLFRQYFEERNKAKLLFTLKQGDFVYLPNENEEVILDKESPLYNQYWGDLKERGKNIYVVQKFSKKQIYFIKHTIADIIKKDVEFGSQNCYETVEGRSIKENCFKLEIDRLGNIVKVIKR